jgi:hypothetical protein
MGAKHSHVKPSDGALGGTSSEAPGRSALTLKPPSEIDHIDVGNFFVTEFAKAALPGIEVTQALPTEAHVLEKLREQRKTVVAIPRAAAITAAHRGSQTPAQVYNALRNEILQWNIFDPKQTRMYFEDGKAFIEKDMITGVSTSLVDNGAFSLSFEDVSEQDEIDTDNFRRLRIVVTTREENVVDGNYDIELKLWYRPGVGRTGQREKGDVELYYQKRQSCLYFILRLGVGGHEAYRAYTEKSVMASTRRLLEAGKLVTLPDIIEPPAFPVLLAPLPIS